MLTATEAVKLSSLINPRRLSNSQLRSGLLQRVDGTINSLKGNAIKNWSITFNPTKLLRGPWSEIADFATTSAGAEDGRWHTRAYGGTATKRPIGITGDFQAFFEDGRDLGGYNITIKDT